MNILIIGNGFDLAHQLPTKYTDFLNFMKFINRIENFNGTFEKFKIDNDKYKFSELNVDIQKYISGVIEDHSKKDVNVTDIWNDRKSADDKSDRVKHVERMIELSSKNIWFEWFQEQLNIHPNWVDFESEISKVVQGVENLIPLIPLKIEMISRMPSYQRLINKIIFAGRASDKNITLAEIETIKEKMLTDLNNLIRCFEIYLEDLVKNIDISQLSLDDDEIKKLQDNDIKNLAINCYSCLKENGKKINYMTYIKECKNEECNKAILRVFKNIKIDEINKFIDGISCMSNERKEFYKKIINIRYKIIKEVYNKINNEKIDT